MYTKMSGYAIANPTYAEFLPRSLSENSPLPEKRRNRVGWGEVRTPTINTLRGQNVGVRTSATAPALLYLPTSL